MNFPEAEVPNYHFTDFDGGEIDLLELFEGKNELIAVHNMGRACPNCTMWADGFSGVLKYIESKAAFVVISEDDYQTQKNFATARGWNFRIVSAKDTSFFKDLEFKSSDGELHPGISVFSKKDDGEHARGRIFRTNATNFRPFDDFCSVWHLWAMLPSADGKR